MSDFKKYALRVHRQAAADIDEAYAQIAARSGVDYADEWQDGLREVIATLATLPERRPLADENDLFNHPVWSFPYRLRTSRAIYRILFEKVEDDQDAPYINCTSAMLPASP